MSRRNGRRQHGTSLINAATNVEFVGPCSITMLPNEVLLDVIRYLRVIDGFFLGCLTRESARDVASVSRTCRRFYQLAMPTLWHAIELQPGYELPRRLSAYPDTGSKRALSFVRRVGLSVYKEPFPEYLDRDDFHELLNYVSGCLRIVKDTSAIDTMSFRMGLYDSNNYPSEYHEIVEASNSIVLQILKHIRKMTLRELQFTAGQQTARITEIISIIEQKLDKLDIHIAPISDWAPRLPHFHRLKELHVSCSQPWNLQAETTFWTAVSHLPNLKVIKVDVPIPPTLELPYPHVIHLELEFGMLDYAELSHSFVNVFDQMPRLEKLRISDFSQHDMHEQRTIPITTIACKNLKDITLSFPIPRGLVSTIARHCPHLTKCSISANAIDDEDLHQLSLSCPNLQQIRFRCAENITRLEYFATFHQLEILQLYYSAGKYISQSLLLNLVDSCLKLNQFSLSDWRSRGLHVGKTYFEAAAPKDLFGAAAELLSYFEPKIRASEYIVRIDRLREDISQFKGLTGDSVGLW